MTKFLSISWKWLFFKWLFEMDHCYIESKQKYVWYYSFTICLWWITIYIDTRIGCEAPQLRGRPKQVGDLR
jgi:hypothetical protein